MKKKILGIVLGLVLMSSTVATAQWGGGGAFGEIENFINNLTIDILFSDDNVYSIGSAAQAAKKIWTHALDVKDGSITNVNDMTVGEINNIIIVDGTNYAQTSTGILAAVTALGADGGKIILSQGLYTITASMTISTDDIVFEGVGIETHLQATGAAASLGSMFTISGDNVTLKDMWIDGNTNVSSYLLIFTNNVGCSVLNCKVGSSRTDAIVFGPSSDYGLIDGCYVYDCGNPDAVGDACSGVEIEDGADNIIVSNNHIVNCDNSIFPHSHSGSPPCLNITMIGNNIVAGADGNCNISLSSAGTSPCTNWAVIGNILSGGGIIETLGDVEGFIIEGNCIKDANTALGAILIRNTSLYGIIKNNLITGSTAQFGMQIGGFKCIVEGNMIIGVDMRGIDITATGDKSIIRGNIVRDTDSGGFDYGIRSDPDAADVIISNNYVGGQECGIRIQGDNCLASGNVLDNNSSYDFWVDDTAEGASLVNNKTLSATDDYLLEDDDAYIEGLDSQLKKIIGYITAASTDKYVTWGLEADGKLYLKREDTYIEGFSIEMPVISDMHITRVLAGESSALGVHADMSVGTKYDITFDGTNDYIYAQDQLESTDYPFTMVIRAKTADTDGTLFQIAKDDNDYRHYGIAIASNKAQIHASNVSFKSAASAADFNDDAWHVFIADFENATSMKLYVDNVLVATQAVSVTYNTEVSAWALAREAKVAASNFLAGEISMAAFYSSSLTAGNRATIQTGGTVAGAIARWDFNEGQGFDLNDQENANDGAIFGGDWELDEKITVTHNGTVGTIATSTGDLKLSPNGETIITRPLILEPSTDQTRANDSTITIDDGIVRVAGSGGAVTLDVAPAIEDGAEDGQVVVIQGTHDTNTVTIADNCNCQLAGSVNAALGKGDIISLAWDSGESDWYEMYRADN